MRNWHTILLATILAVGFILPNRTSAQYFKATQRTGTTSTSIIIILKPDFTFSDKLNEVGFTLQVPKNVGGSPVTLPVITVLNNIQSTTFPTWVQQSESASDPDFYNFKFGATAVGSAPVLPVSNGDELPVVELQLTVPLNVMPLLRLAHLPAGGPSSQYGAAFIDGSLNDRTQYTQMFYGNAVVPAAPVSDDVTGYNTYQYVLPSGTVPVMFTSFNVIKKDKDAELIWTVENENAITNRYEIERSLDSRTFERIQTVLPSSGAGSSKSYVQTDWSFKDLKNTNSVFYRIKQIDTDGRYVYTDIRSLMISTNTPGITLYPNPTISNAKIEFTLEKEEKVVILITDASGKLVLKKNGVYQRGVNVVNIYTYLWAQGVYGIKIGLGKSVQMLKLVKK
jgi:hypothetical protein